MRQSKFADPKNILGMTQGTPWKAENIGDTIDGTFIGSRIVQMPSKFDGNEHPVLVLDFTEVMLNGVAVPDQKEIFSIATNPFLETVWTRHGFQIGQIAAIKFAGRNPKYNNSKDFQVAATPGEISQTWKGHSAAPSQAIAAATPAVDTSFPDAPGSNEPNPFEPTPAEYDAKIKALAAGKIGATEATYKQIVTAVAGLEYTEANVKAIYAALVAKFGA